MGLPTAAEIGAGLDRETLGSAVGFVCHTFYAVSFAATVQTMLIDWVYALVFVYSLVHDGVYGQMPPKGLVTYLTAWVIVWAFALPACGWLWSTQVPVLVLQGGVWGTRVYTAVVERTLGEALGGRMPSARVRFFYEVYKEKERRSQHIAGAFHERGSGVRRRRLRECRRILQVVGFRAAVFVADTGRRSAAWRLDHAGSLVLAAMCIVWRTGQDLMRLASAYLTSSSTWVVRCGAVHSAPCCCDNCGVCLEPLCATSGGIVGARAGAARRWAPGLSVARLRGCGGIAAARESGQPMLAAVARSPCGHAFHAACAMALVHRQKRCPLCREQWDSLADHDADEFVQRAVREDPVLQVMLIGSAVGIPLNLFLLSSFSALSWCIAVCWSLLVALVLL